MAKEAKSKTLSEKVDEFFEIISIESSILSLYGMGIPAKLGGLLALIHTASTDNSLSSYIAGSALYLLGEAQIYMGRKTINKVKEEIQRTREAYLIASFGTSLLSD